MKEKTLNKKMMTPYEAVRKFEEEWDNNNPELKCVLDSEDVRQFIKEILDEIDMLKRNGLAEWTEYQKNLLEEFKQIIKQKTGFEELE